jgi:hypothetical protein
VYQALTNFLQTWEPPLKIKSQEEIQWRLASFQTTWHHITEDSTVLNSNTPENTRRNANCGCHSELAHVDPWLTSQCALRGNGKPQNVQSMVPALKLNQPDLWL